jgi:hypothetical protein
MAHNGLDAAENFTFQAKKNYARINGIFMGSWKKFILLSNNAFNNYKKKIIAIVLKVFNII